MSFELFSFGAMLFCLCVAPVGLTRLPQPAPARVAALRLKRLFEISPVGTAGCITVGLANGAFWVFAPVYAHSLGFSTRELALFMSVFIAGGALIQWPLGRFSDRFDRRWMIATICAVACVSAIALALLGATPWRASIWLYVLIAIFGSAMLPLYSLSIAHANDRLPRSEFVEASAGLLLINAGASVVGPVLGSLVTSAAGSLQALFLYTAVVHACMAIFTATRILAREAPRDETRERFEPVPQGSPASLPLDPRAPEHAS
jgi:MFS family permease